MRAIGPLILKRLLVVGGDARHDYARRRVQRFGNSPHRPTGQPMIRARAQAGANGARQNGSRSGKPPGRPKTDATIVGAIRASLAAGISIRKAAKLHGVGISTVQRVKASTG
jgi:hypothetical protein